VFRQFTSRAQHLSHGMQAEQPVSLRAIFINHIRDQDPSAATFNHLRDLRLVCTEARNRIDFRLHDDNWRASWLRRAHEFCNDLPTGTALVPGTPLNAGVERMIRNDLMAELVTGMNEFKMDATTQQMCIQKLQAMLDPPYVPGTPYPPFMQCATYVGWARNTPGLFRSIIGAVRAHPMNMIIQLGGLALMTKLISSTTGPQLVPYVTLELADYAIATLIENVHLNMNRPALAILSLDTLRLLIHMHSSQGVADVHFLTSGEHAIPGFVMTLMHMNQAYEMLVWRSTSLMHELLESARLPQYTAMLQAFDVGQAEEYMLASMTHWMHDGRLQSVCLHLLHTLYQMFPLRVTRPTDVLACLLRNLASHGTNADLRDTAINLMSTIVEGFWSPTAPIRELLHGQIRPCVSDIMQVVADSLRNADPGDPFSGKSNCITFFNVLSTLCENHPQQIALVNQTQTLPLLHQQFHLPLVQFVDGPWREAYTRLTGILAGR